MFAIYNALLLILLFLVAPEGGGQYKHPTTVLVVDSSRNDKVPLLL